MAMPDKNDVRKAVKTGSSQQVHQFTKKDLKPNRSRPLPDRNAARATPVSRSMDRSDATTETYGPGMRGSEMVDPFNPFRNVKVRR